MLWDFDLFRPRSVRIVPRLVRYASPGDIIVIHDGHHSNPRSDRRHTPETIRLMVPALKAKGFSFGRLCDMHGA
jgi:peptidoglycan/xylan/chitin deacetylase (PgdA/CDA1 family)